MSSSGWPDRFTRTVDLYGQHHASRLTRDESADGVVGFQVAADETPTVEVYEGGKRTAPLRLIGPCGDLTRGTWYGYIPDTGK